MGVKDLWSVLTPHAERKPIFELRGKTVAIDLAGWVCESLNVVDYFVHPRHHLKNLFFRTCYLIWEDVNPIFVLEGVAPKLKSQVIAKRNDIQFRGIKPREKQPVDVATSSQVSKDKGRTRFNHVLKQCESLLLCMGIQCVQAPGEAEAYCAFLNKKGLVDGVISQDSDCFAYGAVRVYRNFSVSTQGAQSAQGGAVDIYDMSQICRHLDFGQHKIIVMALLCGCDYCPEGIDGVGRDGVMKLFNKYKDNEILNRVRSWRSENAKYTAIEMRVDDKSICTNCGHMGRTQSHTKSGCGVCRTNRGCDETLWREERLSLKAELMMRKKALSDPTFPNEEIIAEFLTDPPTVPSLNLSWKSPNIVKFIKQIGNLLQWTEIYCFQKMLPVLTRWQVCNAKRLNRITATVYVEPKEIIKKRTLKGVPSLELIWHDQMGMLNGLIPDEQLKEFELENDKGMQALWTTVEPLNLMQEAYPDLVAAFLKAKEKPKKAKKCSKSNQKLIDAERPPLGSLENLNDLIAATDEIAKCLKPKRSRKAATSSKKGLQLIDKFFKQIKTNTTKRNTPMKFLMQCSTPQSKCLPFELEESDFDENKFNMSEIVNEIVKSSAAEKIITHHAGHRLHYEPILNDFNLSVNERSMDDLDLLVARKRDLSITKDKELEPKTKRMSLDDSFDVLVNMHTRRNVLNKPKNSVSSAPLKTHLDRFKEQHHMLLEQQNTTRGNANKLETTMEDGNVSYFFNQHADSANIDDDEFENLMSLSMKIQADNESVVLLSDSASDEAV